MATVERNTDRKVGMGVVMSEGQGSLAPPLRMEKQKMVRRRSDGNLRSRWNSESDFQRLQESLKRGLSNSVEQDTDGGGLAKKVCQQQIRARGAQIDSHDGPLTPSERKWTDLPVDITAFIFSKLPVETRLFVVAGICRAWKSAARVPTCYTDVDADEWSQGFALYLTLDFRPGPEVVQQLEQTVQDGFVGRVATLAGPHLSAMRVRQCTEGALRVLSLSCANIQKLELPDLRGPFNDELIRALPNFRRLQHLSLQPLFLHPVWTNSPVLREDALLQIAECCPELVELDLTECRGLKGAGLAAVAQKCRRLTALNVDSCLVQREAKIFLRSLSSETAQLTCLNMDDCGVDEEGLSCISRLPTLIDLSLHRSSFPQALIKVAVLFKQLLRVDLSDNPWLGDADVTALAKAAPGLTRVDVSSSSITDATLLALGRHCREVRAVHADYTTVSDKGVRALVSGCPKLTGLSLKRTRLSDEAFFLVARKCPDLTRVAFACQRSSPWTNSTSPNGHALCALVTHCPKLSGIGLSLVDLRTASPASQGGAPSARAMLEIVARMGSELVDVRFDGPEGAEFGDINEALVEWARHCPNLRMLDLNHLTNLNDETMATIASLCPNLEQVGFAWCDCITNAALVSLATMCRHMRILEICVCRGVTPDAFTDIGRTRTDLQVLSAHNVVFRILRNTD